MDLKCTIVESGNKRTVVDCHYHSRYIKIPFLESAYIITDMAQKDLDDGKKVVYTDSVFPLDNPSLQIIKRFIEVEKINKPIDKGV
jgi:hypothetical protein